MVRMMVNPVLYSPVSDYTIYVRFLPSRVSTWQAINAHVKSITGMNAAYNPEAQLNHFSKIMGLPEEKVLFHNTEPEAFFKNVVQSLERTHGIIHIQIHVPLMKSQDRDLLEMLQRFLSTPRHEKLVGKTFVFVVDFIDMVPETEMDYVATQWAGLEGFLNSFFDHRNWFQGNSDPTVMHQIQQFLMNTCSLILGMGLSTVRPKSFGISSLIRPVLIHYQSQADVLRASLNVTTK